MKRQPLPSAGTDAQELIAPRLADEPLLIAHPFIKMFRYENQWVPVRFELVLTDRHLHFFRIERTYWHKKPKGIHAHTSMRLVDITDISIKGSGDQTHLLIRNRADTLDTFIANASSDTEGFIAALENAIAAMGRTADATRSGGLADELKKLSELRAEGVLSEEDWERAKNLYFGKPRSKKDEAVRMLRSLHDLHRSGVLSEGEFNMKKWDILSRDQ